jgi:hypothetical protein
MRLGGHEPGSKINVTQDRNGDNRVVIDGTVNRILDNNIPALRTIGSLIETAEVVVEAGRSIFDKKFDEIIGEVYGERDYNKAFSKMLRVMAFWAGAKFREFDEEERKSIRAERIMDEAQRRRRGQRRQQPGFQERSRDAIRQRMAQLRRFGLMDM